MSDLTTYRIADENVYWSPIQSLLDNGSLVTDTRLQAIADAWRQERKTGQSNPEITDLLDALVKEESDGT